MKDTDPLAQAEKAVQQLDRATHHGLHPIHKKYPLLFLFLLTFSVAAVFHGIDRFLDTIPFVNQFPLGLVALGIIGLFITGSLYKRLGRDKFE